MSLITAVEYTRFLQDSYGLMTNLPQYFSPDEDINCLELAHLLPEVPETVLAIYVGINDAACNKGLDMEKASTVMDKILEGVKK